MIIEDGLVVTLEFTLKDSAGKVLESTDNLLFKMGEDPMLPGLAKAMVGMKVGEKRTGTIAPGELVPANPKHRRDVLFSEFPGGEAPAVGTRFQAKGADGNPVIFEIVEKKKSSVQVQLLHILHETEVHYEIKIISARRANLPPPAPVDVPDMTDLLLED